MADINHVMVDLETMGTMPGCVGLSIGAVRFDPDAGTLHQEFYRVVSLSDSLERFLRTEQGTVDWWSKQSEEARKVLQEAVHPDAPKLPDVMQEFNGFLLGMGGMRSIRLYGNGADFDNPILRIMWDAAGVDPFNSKAGFFGGRCYRTLKSLDELFGPAFAAHKPDRQGTYHNALDDAKTQAVHLMEIVARIRGLV
jgi:hypothetical protein